MSKVQRHATRTRSTYGNNTVEYHAVVVTTLRQLCEVFAGLENASSWSISRTLKQETYPGGMIPIELELDVTQTSL